MAKWLSLSNAGEFEEAEVCHFDTLFSSVLKTGLRTEIQKRVVGKTDVLFSDFGFTPEPILLTQRALKPQVQYYFLFR